MKFKYFLNILKKTIDFGQNHLQFVSSLPKDWGFFEDVDNHESFQLRHPKYGKITVYKVVNSKNQEQYNIKHIHPNNTTENLFHNINTGDVRGLIKKHIQNIHNGTFKIHTDKPTILLTNKEVKKSEKNGTEMFKALYENRLPIGSVKDGKKKVFKTSTNRSSWRSVRSGSVKDDEGNAISVKEHNNKVDNESKNK